MDSWGSLTMLIKKQQADKRRKAEIRALFIKRKKLYIHTNSTKNEFDFPELTPRNLEKIKTEIRLKLKRRRMVDLIISVLFFIIILAGLVYFYYIFDNGR